MSASFFLSLFLLAVAGQLTNYQFDASKAAGNPFRGPMRSCTGCSDVNTLPHSLEFTYMTLKSVMNGINNFDWNALENVLKASESRTRQAVIRFHLDYPGSETREKAVPAFLLPGLSFFPYDAGIGWGNDPDFSNQNLVAAVENFIENFGKKYDGDPRLAFVQVGLIGPFGEWWHPKGAPTAPTTTHDRVLNAYERAFTRTKVLARYPDATGFKGPAQRNLGYHDDSFSYETLGSGQFYSKLVEKGGGDVWKRFPIGGEIRPETFCVFNDPPCSHQNFDDSVATTHASFVGLSGLFEDGNSKQRNKAITSLEKMGYQFYVTSIDKSTSGSSVTFRVSIVNRGNAPFYYYLQLQIISGGIPFIIAGGIESQLLPSSTPTTYSIRIDNPNDVLLLKLWSPMLLKFQTIRFANKEIEPDGSISIGVLPPLRPTTAVVHRGCFEDRTNILPNKRQLPGNTRKKCFDDCKSKGFSVAGVEYGQECLCGSESDIPTNGGVGGCTMTCSGDQSEFCGGEFRVNILSEVGTVNLGCFRDDGPQRVFSLLRTFVTSNSHDRCLQACQDNGYNVAGVQYGIECYCGSGDNAVKALRGTDCNSGCPGNPGQTCGGSFRINIVAGEFVDYGCFDDSGPRILPNPANPPSNSHQACWNACRERGYSAAGVEYGYECWCGNAANIPTNKRSTGCTMQCPGNSKQNCGGNTKITILVSSKFLQKSLPSAANAADEIPSPTQTDVPSTTQTDVPSTTQTNVPSTTQSDVQSQTQISIQHNDNIPGYAVGLLVLASLLVVLLAGVLVKVLRPAQSEKF